MKIKITAHADGYARAGLRHTRRGRIHNVDDLTEEQCKILSADPNVRIVPVHDDPVGDGPAESKADESGQQKPPSGKVPHRKGA